MENDLKRVTLVLTPEIEPLLDRMKKEIFYNCSKSEMIRTLIEAGWNADKNNDKPVKQIV